MAIAYLWLMSKPKKLYLFDAMALIYRAYFAMMNNPLINSKGLNVSAISGFTNTLHEILTKYGPSHAAVVFDAPGPTDREGEHDFYKANRQAAPEDLTASIPYIKQIVKAFNIPMLEVPGYEADDLIGTLAKQAASQGFDVYMVTPDKDFAQLVDKHIFIHKPPYKGNGHEILDVAKIKEKWEVNDPLQVIDILGMWGDSSDNIPGIPGVGEKTAKKFIKEFGSMEGLYANTDKLKGKIKENVENNRELAMISRKLATILLDAPVEFDVKDFEMEEPDKEELAKIFADLEFRTQGKRILGDQYDYAETAGAGGQMTLFADETEEEKPRSDIGKNIGNTDHHYETVTGSAALEKLAARLMKVARLSFDSETTGLDPTNCDLVGLSFSVEPHKAWYVPVPEDRDEALAVLEHFRPVFGKTGLVKIGQNIKYDMLVLKSYGVEVCGPVFDTMVAHYLLDADGRHNMDILAETYLGYTPVPIESLIGKRGSEQGNMRDVPLEEISEYAAEDADITLQLADVLEKEIDKGGYRKLYDGIEGPLIPVLTDMENDGVAIDSDFLAEYSSELEGDITRLQRSIYDQAGTEFNLDSPKQLGEILFERMGIDYKGKKTKTGQYSTNEETLLKLESENPIVNDILDYRELTKLKSTYVDALPRLVNPRTGMIHTTFNQTIAATGRLSSVNPNLQNIPIRTDKGREIRKAFIPRKRGNILLSADYSQVELRIVASISNDEKMIAAFRGGADIHAATAANVFGVDLSAVDATMRRKAKVVNFGIIYGISAFGLSQRLDIPRKEAADLIDNYFEQYSGIRKYMDDAVEYARENGYVETLMGRRRYLRDINSRNYTVRSFAERNAINTPIQGTAADIIKLAMINVHRALEKHKFKARMILQVHDELLFDAPESESEALSDLVRKEMSGALKLKVPLDVEIGTGKNWLEAH